MQDINLNDYIMVQPSYIKKSKGDKIFYDIEIENDNTFFIKTLKYELLSHNCDGNHIASLILNFFNKWFPNIIKQGKLYKLITPLVSVEMKGKRKYYYSLDDFSKEANKSNARYLKGLGSNDLKDWEYIFTNLTLERMSPDEYSDKILTIVFGNNANLRKKWLSIK